MPRRGGRRAARPDVVSKLSGDEHGVLFILLCDVLDPGIAVAFSSVNRELRTATRAPRQQLKADHEAAAALCRRLGHRSCKALREVRVLECWGRGLSAEELGLLGELCSVLPELEGVELCEPAVGPDGVRQLVEALRAGALPAVTRFSVVRTHVCDAGATALATALDLGALPRLASLTLHNNGSIGDAGLVALAPALRGLPALEVLVLNGSPIGDEGLAALVAPVSASPSATGGLERLKELHLDDTQISDDGCQVLAIELAVGALPALEELYMQGIAAGDEANRAVYAARANLVGGWWEQNIIPAWE